MKNENLTPLGEKIRKLGIKDSHLAPLLGYASAASVHKKVTGKQQFSVKDAFLLEQVTGGRITKEEVCPDLFGKPKKRRK